jgi:hypothetical protein
MFLLQLLIYDHCRNLLYCYQTIHTACNFLIYFLSKDGDRFWRMPECYVRGSTIKYMRIPDEVIDMVKEEQMKPKGRGDPRGRGAGGRGRGGMPQRGEAPAVSASK